MYCANCGKQINDGVKFCPECGSTTSAAETPVSETPAEESTEEVVETPVEDKVEETIAEETTTEEVVETPVEEPIEKVTEASEEEIPATEESTDAATEELTEAPAEEALETAAEEPTEGAAETSVAATEAATPTPIPVVDSQAQSVSGVPAEPAKKSNKLAIIIIAVVVVLGLAAAAVFALPMLLGSNSNPIAATYDGVKNVLKAESFDAKMTYTEEDGTLVDEEIFLSVIWGSNLANSVVSFEVSMQDGEFRNRTILIDDTLINGHYIAEDDPDSFYDGQDNISEKLSDSISQEFGIDIDIDDIISDNELNPDVIFDELTKAINEAVAMFGLDLEISSVEGVLDVLEDFIYERCSDKKVLEKIVPEHNKSKSGGNTKHEYSIDIVKFVEQFDIFLKEISDDKKYLEKHDLHANDVNALKIVMGMASAISAVELDNPIISLTLDKNDNLVELVIRPNTKGYDNEVSKAAFTLIVENFNNSQVDQDELRARVKGATLW